MRRILPLALAAAVGLAACNGTPEAPAAPDANFTVAEATTVSLAVTGMT